MKNRIHYRTNLYDREKDKREKTIKYIDKDANQMINTFRDNIKRIKNRFEIFDLLKNNNRIEETNDILRFQIVFVMSSLDFFMHEIYSFAFIKIFKNEMPKTNGYKNYKIPLKLLEKALYDAENIDRHLKETFIGINDSFTFMSPGRIRELLNIITSEDEFALVERKLKQRKIIKYNVRLDSEIEHIYDRRNKIAHQTDIEHGEDDKNIINRREVEYYIDVISNFVEELFKVVCLENKGENHD